MKEIVTGIRALEKIKKNKQTYIIVNEELQNKEIVLLKSKKESIEVEITGCSKFDSLEDCLRIIPFELFGVNKKEALEKKNLGKINAYRIKYDNDTIEEIDKKLEELLKMDTMKKNNIGHSSTNVYEVDLKDGKKAILKVQSLSTRNDLKEEYERIKWLQGKCNVPKIYFYQEIGKKKYLLMEKKEGLAAYKTNEYAEKIGQNLRIIHGIDITNCHFQQNTVENLLKIALKNIDSILPQVQETYPNMTKEDVIEFLKNEQPKDKVLVHGDYSLPNILIDENENINLIDLGDVSISTKYFDFFYLKKSMVRNKKMDQWKKLLKGYGIDELDETAMKWIEIVDKALF